jgi:hypothetical protein
MKHGLIAVIAQYVFHRRQVEQLNAFEIPSVRGRDLDQFIGGFRQGDVEALLALAHPVQQKLQRQRCLTGARLPFQQVQVPLGETAMQDNIEARIASTATFGRRHESPQSNPDLENQWL